MDKTFRPSRVTWCNPNGNLWSNPDNWYPRGVPGPEDDVVVIGSADTVVMDQSATVNNLTLE